MNILDTMLCAGETKKDSCQGDSGGEISSYGISINVTERDILCTLSHFWKLIWVPLTLWDFRSGGFKSPHSCSQRVTKTKGPLNCFNPATKRWELCGVVSWGSRCAEPGWFLFIGPRCPWSDLWVCFSLTNKLSHLLKLNWCDSSWWRYKLNTNW